MRRRNRSLHSGSHRTQQCTYNYVANYISQKACESVRAPAGRSLLHEVLDLRGVE